MPLFISWSTIWRPKINIKAYIIKVVIIKIKAITLTTTSVAFLKAFFVFSVKSIYSELARSILLGVF